MKTGNAKRILATLLTLTLAVTTMPMTGFALQTEDVELTGGGYYNS